ncbi:YdcF family protein [Myroides odoratus]|uniref:YdcF family protein n=1 Tax=Myroides odoratus TaxID=256 RepID=UPI0039AF528E
MNTREILKHPIPPELTDELITRLTSLCFYNNPIKSADLLFVFGSNILHKKIGQKINELLKTYTFDTILLTGGIANYEGSIFEDLSESKLLLQYISREKFPNTRFIVEKESRNTLENVVYANELFDLSSIKSIAFLSHSYASMRSYLTLKKVCTADYFYNYQIPIPVNQSNPMITQSNWHETQEGKALVWGEYLRFVTYGIRGDFLIEGVELLIEQIQLCQ